MQSLHPQPGENLHRHRHVHTGKRLRGRFTYNLRDPARGSATLALKNHFIAAIGEYVGTCMFLLFALGGTNVALIPNTSVTGAIQDGQGDSQAAVVNTSNLLYIALCFGFSLAVNAWIFFRVSGGLFNPAGAISPTRAAILTVVQIAGGITGAAIIQAILPGTLNCRTTLTAGMSVARGLFLEMFLTSMLMLAILLLAAEKSKATFLAPIGIGLALFIAELLGVYYTGGSLNPARSFGPDVVLHSFASYHWIYWLGPLMGSTLAAGFYRFIKWLEFETVLGPEDDDNSAKGKLGQLAAPAQNLLDNHTPSKSTEKTEAPLTAQDGAGPANATIVAVQGPGLGDLLTEGDGAQVYNLGQPAIDYDARLDRIEHLLEALAAHGLAPRPSRVSATSETTIPDNTLQNHPKYSIDKTVVGENNV
ncbi:uncharacterized protein JCM6883_003000 [Sporobolomyces salmoneus]|uniref:uncharacterized protein n=1 Tax=Sporobolomyces salmoneus TaxID=183962 RepID=UPI00317444D6